MAQGIDGFIEAVGGSDKLKSKLDELKTRHKTSVDQVFKVYKAGVDQAEKEYVANVLALAKANNFDLSADEIPKSSFGQTQSGELSDDALVSVVGGTGQHAEFIDILACETMECGW